MKPRGRFRSRLGWIGCSLAAVLIFSGRLATAADSDQALYLEVIATGQVTGPFRLRDGGRMLVNGQWLRIRMLTDNRFALREERTNRSYGPFDLIPGRIIEIANEAFSIARIGPFTTPAERPVDAPPETASRPPEPDPWLSLPGNMGFFRIEERLAYLWIEPFRNLSLDWNVEDSPGSSGASLESRAIGATALWNGFILEAALLLQVESDSSIVPDGLSLSNVRVEDGNGWSLALGHTADLYREPPWSLQLGLVASWTEQSGTVNATGLHSTSSPAGTNDMDSAYYQIQEQDSDLDIRELALWVCPGIHYEARSWSATISARVLLLSDFALDGNLDTIDGPAELDASRSHPLGITGELRKNWNEWRVLTRFTVGADTLWRLGVGQEW